MATRQDVLYFNTSCNERFFPPWGPGWVEFFSGGLQIYEQCQMRKVLPLDEFELFTLYHMTDNKLYHRGAGVVQVRDAPCWSSRSPWWPSTKLYSAASAPSKLAPNPQLLRPPSYP